MNEMVNEWKSGNPDNKQDVQTVPHTKMWIETQREKKPHTKRNGTDDGEGGGADGEVSNEIHKSDKCL